MMFPEIQQAIIDNDIATKGQRSSKSKGLPINVPLFFICLETAGHPETNLE